MGHAEDIQRDIGNIEARVVILESAVATIGTDVKAIRSRTDRASGFVMLVFLCVPAAFGAALTWFLSR